MDELKDKNVSGSTVMESCKETVCDQVASGDSEKTRLVEPVDSDVQVQGPDSRSGEGLVAEESGSLNGDGIMAGVMGTDIYVYDVCRHDSGDGGGGNSSQEATGSQGGSGELGSEKEFKDLGGGGGGETGDSDSKSSVDSRLEALKLGTDHEVGKSSGVAESREEGKLEEGGTTDGVVNDVVRDDTASETTSQGVVDADGDGSDVRVGSAVESSTSGEIPVVAEKLAIGTGKESLEGGLGTEDVNSQEIRLSENETQNQRVENGVGDSSAVAGSSADENQVVIASESAEDAIDHAKETNGSWGDAIQESATQTVGVLCDEVWKPGIETTGAPSSAVVEDSSAVTPVVDEETAGMVNSKNSNPKIEAALEDTHDSDVVKGIISSSGKDSVSTEKDVILNVSFNSVDGQTQVSVDEKIASMDNEEIGSPNIEGMGTDAFNENFCFSVEELQGTFEAANGSTENCYDAFADLQSSQQPTQVVVGGEVVAIKDKMLLSSGKNENSITADCSDQTISHTSAQGHSDIVPGRAEQATDDEQAGIQKEQGKLETSNDSTINRSNMCLDSTASCQSTQAVIGDEVAEMAVKVHSDPNSKGSAHMQLDGVLSSGDIQHLKTEVDREKKDAQTTSMYKDKVLASSTKVLEPAERDQELKPEECLDESAACEPADGDSNLGYLMDGQKQITQIEELGQEEKKVIEHHSNSATVCVSTETDFQVLDRGQIVVVNKDMTLDPNTALAVPAEGDQHLKVEEGLNENECHGLFDIESDMGKETVVQEHVADAQQMGLHERQEIEAEEQDSDSEQPKATDDKSAKQAALNAGNTVKANQASYQLPLDDEGEFNVSDLVWGKVRSHPWWPGQIFDPSDASEKAMKYHKKDCFFVAYFGDRTFAWNEASLLKPFMSNFSQVEKQSNSEIFQNAVNCALEEVSRRVELGLACSCMPRDTYDKIKFQVVENAGVRQESSVRESVDKSLHADLFEPGKLVEYVKALAQSPAGGANRLELAVAKSQLLSFNRVKGYSQLPEFQFFGGFSENTDTSLLEDEANEDASSLYKDDGQSSSGQGIVQAQRSSYHKRKHNLKDTVYPRKKERSLSDLMDDSWDSIDDEIGPDGKANNKLVSPSSGKKRRGPDSFPDDSAIVEGRKTISLAKVSAPVTLPKPSFKIGECIRRVASQMTGSPSILKSNSQKSDGGNDGLDGSEISFHHSEDPEMRRTTVPTEYSSLDDLLSQLHLAAQDPSRGYSFLTVIISFFSDFRNTVIMEKHHDKVGGKRRQASPSIGGFPETFEFEDMNDTYWTDRVIQNGSEEQPPRKSRKRDTPLVSVDSDKPLNRSNSRKRYSDGNGGLSSEKPVPYVDENAPAELVLHFPVVDSVPSETTLIKMFRRFGPLKEYETETDKDTNRARVVFKKCSDAEAAYGSAPKFNIFGSTLVNYQLNYTISVPFKTQPVARHPGEEDETLFLQF